MTGSGEKAFIAGFDINEIKSIFEKGAVGESGYLSWAPFKGRGCRI